jgi:amino acid transporter
MASSLLYTLIYLREKSFSDFEKKDKFFFSLCFSSLFSYIIFVMIITFLYKEGLIDYEKFHLLTPVVDPNFWLEWLILCLLLFVFGAVLIRTARQVGTIYVFISLIISVFTLIYVVILTL